jgi:hypothetical protein
MRLVVKAPRIISALRSTSLREVLRINGAHLSLDDGYPARIIESRPR